MIDAFGVVDDVLLKAVQGIIDLITAPGLINLDFADVRSVMKDAGPALIGLGRGRGENRATDAARQAIASPLLEASIEGARGILFNVSGPSDLRLREVRLAADAIRERADPEANVIFGASFSESLGEDVLITLIATGLTVQERSATPPVEAAETASPPPAAEFAPIPAEAPPVVAPVPAVESPPVPEARRLPRRPARPAADMPASDAIPAPAQHIRARSAVGPDAPDDPTQAASGVDENDLDVPSFLRGRGRSTSGT